MQVEEKPVLRLTKSVAVEGSPPPRPADARRADNASALSMPSLKFLRRTAVIATDSGSTPSGRADQEWSDSRTINFSEGD